MLGVMVFAAGLELAKIGVEVNWGASDLWEESHGGDSTSSSKVHKTLSEKERNERRTVMLMTTAAILAFKNDAVGFAAGMLCTWAYRLVDWVSVKLQARSRSSERTPLLS